MSKIYGVNVTKMRKFGEANQAICPLCFSPIVQVKSPQYHDIGFKQPLPPGFESNLPFQINYDVPVLHPEIEKRKKRQLLG